MNTVQIRVEDLTLPAYLPAPPDKNPMFLETRVYQGSSGKVYPLPFTDRIAEKPVDRQWKAVWIENEFIRAMVLPEIGGRIHVLQDKSTGYDVLYNQPVIKPALVGLAGPWISGGIEFNWPQHHRPATFLPVNFEIEEHADGSKTIWCGDHDPMCRMKGMHGVCLHPGKSYLELKARAYNRTRFVQTFLWWANVATRVHEAYKSFFPPDVYYVADHARRSMSEYPLAEGFYYGVNYGERGRTGVPASEVPAQFVPPHCGNQSGRASAPDLPKYAPNDLTFYANIPVPTSYMCLGSHEDFFGGYDYAAQAGIIHVANHHISPGKKQWTWGNHEFGYAWDRNLTDADAQGEFGPYIEIMAGVYTDNQPDFSFLQPGETKTWSQYWYPIQKTGPARHANLDAALSLNVVKGKLRLGVAVTATYPGASIVIRAKGQKLADLTRDLSPATPFIEQIELPRRIAETDLLIRVTDADGNELIAHQPKPLVKGKVPPPATEPPAPDQIASADELFITGLHLDQYRHATRSPMLYWREALRRDPLDYRCNNAAGLWHLKRGEFTQAEKHFRAAIERLTRRNPNPYDGEAYYNLGLCLRYLNRPDEAYAAFYKATWNQAWAAAGYHAIAEIDCTRKHWPLAFEHLNQSLRFDTDNLRARNLQVLVLRLLGRTARADALLQTTRQLDPLDWWSRDLAREPLTCDLPTQLDLAHDYAAAGFYAEAITLLRKAAAKWAASPSIYGSSRGNESLTIKSCEEKFSLVTTTATSDSTRLRSNACDSDESSPCGPSADDSPSPGGEGRGEGERILSRQRQSRSSLPVHGEEPLSSSSVPASGVLPDQSWGALPLVHYTLAWLLQKAGDSQSALAEFKTAAALPSDYCFPSRLEEITILEAALAANPADARAPYYLGNLLYDRRRHQEAIRLWEKSAKLDPNFSIVWRNLGIGYFNIRHQPAKARAAYNRAFAAAPADARLLYERDQLSKRLGDKPDKRLRELEAHVALVASRDDLSIELCALYNQTGRHEEAARRVAGRQFQPWEGGEGGPLGQHVRAHLALGRAALAASDAATAKQHFETALTSPRNLSEAKHLLANQSDIHYWLGCALAALGDTTAARTRWLAAAKFKGDFQEMSVRAFSEMTYYSALSWEKLGRRAQAKKLFQNLLAYAQKLQRTPAKIDYFATSLPTMLLFADDLQYRQETTALFLQAQARLGLGQKGKAKSTLQTVLTRDPNHALAADLLSGLK